MTSTIAPRFKVNQVVYWMEKDRIHSSVVIHRVFDPLRQGYYCRVKSRTNGVEDWVFEDYLYPSLDGLVKDLTGNIVE